MGRPSTARARLIASARELIHASNYGSASVDDLCTAAGVNKGSFYYFFPAKRDLALAVLDEQWAGAQESFLGPAFKPDVPPLERISRFFRKAAQAQRKPVVLGCPFGNLAIEMGSLDPLIRDRVAQILDGYRGYFAQALEEAVSSGDIQPLDVPAVSQGLVAYFQGAMLLAKTSNDAGVIERLGQQALKLVGADAAPAKSSARKKGPLHA
jgi:TetR/AcrR family transcriptional repressor of nem operon